MGCKVNQYENNQICQLLTDRDQYVADAAAADLVVVNTCCVTHIASAKSRQIIRKAEIKPSGDGRRRGVPAGGPSDEWKNMSNVPLSPQADLPDTAWPCCVDPAESATPSNKPCYETKIKDKTASGE